MQQQLSPRWFGGVGGLRLLHAAARISAPTLLVRGALSDVVGEAEIALFRELMPHAETAEISGPATCWRVIKRRL